MLATVNWLDMHGGLVGPILILILFPEFVTFSPINKGE